MKGVFYEFTLYLRYYLCALCGSRTSFPGTGEAKLENNERKFAEIGTGNLNLDECYRACVESGVEYIIIEQDSCDMDLFEAAKISFENLKKIAARNA